MRSWNEKNNRLHFSVTRVQRRIISQDPDAGLFQGRSSTPLRSIDICYVAFG